MRPAGFHASRAASRSSSSAGLSFALATIRLNPSARTHSSREASRLEKNGLFRSGTSAATIRAGRPRSCAAARLGSNFSSRAALRTASARSGRTLDLPLSTFDTVPVDTPARAATSLMETFTL